MSSEQKLSFERKDSLLIIKGDKRIYCIPMKHINHFYMDLDTSTLHFNMGQTYPSIKCHIRPETTQEVYEYVETQVKEFYESYD